MVTAFLTKIGATILAGFTVITGFLSPAQPAPIVIIDPISEVYDQRINSLENQISALEEDAQFGATLPIVVATFETSLAFAVGSTDTSMTLVAASTTAGGSLSGYIGFVIDEGETAEEFIVCTVDGRALTSCLRGIDPIDGNLEVSALQKAHRRGSSVKITNHPVLAVAVRILNGDERLPNRLQYETSTAPCSDGDHICDKTYIDGVAIAGASDASSTAKGIVELATSAELQTGNATGTTGAFLVVPAELTSATSSNTAGIVPVTQDNASSTIDLNYLPLTTEGWEFEVNVTSTGETSIIGATTTIGDASTDELIINASTTHNATTTYNEAVIINGAFTANATATFNGNVIGIATPVYSSAIFIPSGTLTSNGQAETSVASTTLFSTSTITANDIVEISYIVSNGDGSNSCSAGLYIDFGGGSFTLIATSTTANGGNLFGKITFYVASSTNAQHLYRARVYDSQSNDFEYVNVSTLSTELGNAWIVDLRLQMVGGGTTGCVPKMLYGEYINK